MSINTRMNFVLFNAMPRVLIVLLVLVGLQACSSKQWYNVIQENRQQACEREVRKSVYEECQQQYGKSYEEYERERTGRDS